MPNQPYSHPPITEAVIEIRFADAVSDRLLLSVSHALAQRYPGEQVLQNMQLEVSVAASSRPATAQWAAGPQAYRRASSSEAELAIVAPTSLIVSQLPDYPGWEVFFDRFRQDWSLWKREVGYQKIVRVGVRYINRLDLPAAGPVVDHEHYLNVFARTPDELGPTMLYGVQAIFRSEPANGLITINSGIVPSPLEGYLSIMLDIDVGRDNDLPQRDEGLLSLLQELRVEKNRLFEACITDRARELFST